MKVFQVGCGMPRIRRRVELLEQAFLPVVQGPPHVIHLQFVDADRKIVDTLDFEVPSPPAPPRNRRWNSWRLPSAQGGW